jgi:uncharacterized protein YwgA
MDRNKSESQLSKKMRADRVLTLALLYTAGGEIEGRTRFQKLAFLADQQLEDFDIDPYEFIPYDYGPFDSDLYDNLEWLESEGLVESSESRTFGGDKRYDYRLTKKGKVGFEQNVPTSDNKTLGDLSESQQKLKKIYEVANDVVEEYNEIPISNLLRRIYDEYPRYAENSVLN